MADNGGPVPTMAIRAGSDAIDSGQGAQRQDATGVQSNKYVDIGAFEYRTPTGAPILRKIFWTDDDGNAIYRANENASHQLSAVQKIIATGQTPEDMEFDETTGRIFWVEGTGTTGRVLSAEVDGRNPEILLSSDTHPELVAIHGIAVDADTGLLYVTSDAATAPSGTTDKIIAYQLNTTGDAILGAVTTIAERTDSSGTIMYEVYDIDIGTNRGTGDTQLVWAERGANDRNQTDKGYAHWNLTNGAKGKTVYTGPWPGQLQTSVAWNFTDNLYYQTDLISYQSVDVDPVTMGFTYNVYAGSTGTASGLAFDAETDTLWISEVGTGANTGRIFAGDSSVNASTEAIALANVNSPRALALASISRVSPAPITSDLTNLVNDNDVDDSTQFSLANVQPGYKYAVWYPWL